MHTTLPSSLEGRLFDAFNKLEIVDTLEHTVLEQERTSHPVDFFTLADTMLNQCSSAGMSRDSIKLVRNPLSPLMERWHVFEPFWRVARFTGYAQVIRTAIRDIYGVDEISAATLPEIGAAMERINKPGLYRYLLRERTKIRKIMLDRQLMADRPDPELFALMPRFDAFIAPASAADVRNLEEATGCSITSLYSLKLAMEKDFERCLSAGMLATKSFIAYERDLNFENATEADADRDFESLMKDEGRWPERDFEQRLVRPYRRLEDHMFHHMVGLADAHRIPVVIHTGWLGFIGETRGNFIQNANPVHLTKVFILHPRVNFDLLHISYPFYAELSWIVQIHANVYMDLATVFDFSPAFCRQALDWYLELLPVNKILGFGADKRFAELTFAVGKIARASISQVLAGKVQNGLFNEEDALQIGRMLLHDNAARLFLEKS